MKSLPLILGVGTLGLILVATTMTDSEDDIPTNPVGDDPPGLNRSLGLIGQLDADVQLMAVGLLRAAYAAGISLVVTQGYRSSADQNKLYQQGRTTPGPIVTKAPAGSSWHEFRRAFDVAVLNNGKVTWPNDSSLWNRIGAIGKSQGLEWGGDWTTIKDLPHFQFTRGETLAQARAGNV